MRVHVFVSIIKGLPYEDTLCESRNTQQDLSLLSEAHITRETQKTETGKGKMAEEKIDMTVSLRHREMQAENIETNRETYRK